MLVKKKFVFLLAMAAFVTACGGGGDGPSATAGGSTAGGSQTGDNNTPPTDNNGGNDGNTGGNTGGNNPPADGGGDTVADQRLDGRLELVANQLVYIRANRTMYHAITVNQFESEEGMFDIAFGEAALDPQAQVPQEIAPAAPIAAFGFRVNDHVRTATGEPAAGSQTVVGRVAFSLTERAGSKGIGEGEVAESMRAVIDGVTLVKDENGKLISAKVRTGAQMHVYGRNAANQEVQASIAVPESAVTIISMENVLDSLGDTTSVVLLVNLEAAFSSAGQALAAMENLQGHFAMQATLSVAELVRPAGDEWDYKDLVGQAITVNNQQPVTGAGISGNAWIRMNP